MKNKKFCLAGSGFMFLCIGAGFMAMEFAFSLPPMFLVSAFAFAIGAACSTASFFMKD